MTITRRLRFEILRRDNNTCRYCGASAPDVSLTVDHVIPSALGGKDEPENLVTACVPCNAGKAATSPNEGLVADVAVDALRWASAMKAAAAIRAERRAEIATYVKAFDKEWNGWHWGDDPANKVERPDDWRVSLERFHSLDVDPALLTYAMETAMRARVSSRAYATFKYMCGVIYNELDRRAQIARDIVDADDSGP
jgi:hypothetical protein